MPRVYQILEDALETYVFNRAIIVQMLDFDPYMPLQNEPDSGDCESEL